MRVAAVTFSATPSISRPPTAIHCARAQRIFDTADPSILAGASSSSSMAIPSIKWAHKTVVVPPQRRGCHLITSKIVREIEQDLSSFRCGLAHLFLHHTSASLTINENCDSDVRHDIETFLTKLFQRIGLHHGSIHWKEIRFSFCTVAGLHGEGDHRCKDGVFATQDCACWRNQGADVSGHDHHWAKVDTGATFICVGYGEIKGLEIL